jgi:tetratricopeptide (TPR) repeat protein
LEGVEHGPADRSEDLEQRVATMKRELDALQIHVMEAAKPPWYKRLAVFVPIAVSFGALAFSFWTDQKAEDRLNRQEAHEARVELRGLIQRLQELPKENFELSQTYANNATALNQLSGFVNTEQQILTLQAAEIIEILEGEVGPVEYYAMAYAFSSFGQPAQALRFLEDGLEVAKDPISEAPLLRQQAVIRFGLGDLEGGRSSFQRALDVFEDDPNYSESTVVAFKLFTEISWAQTELSRGECDEALQHILAAKEYASQVGQGSLVAQRDQAERDINNYCNSQPAS